jgi:regulatory protein
METKKITALKQQKRKTTRVNVYLDGEFAFGVEKVIAAKLAIGQELQAQQLAELQDSENLESAYQKSLHYISFRPRSINETRKHFSRKGMLPEILDAVIERLLERNYLNDSEFAQNWVENRVAFKPRSRFALKGELFQKGIDNQIMEEVLADLDDSKLAQDAAQKRVHRLKALEWNEFRKKLMGYLGRRGFPYPICDEVSRNLWGQIHNETEHA